MSEYVLITLDIKKKSGSSAMRLEGHDYGDCQEKIGSYLNFAYKFEKFLDITLHSENKDHSIIIDESLEKASFEEANESISEFLKYVYGTESQPTGELKTPERVHIGDENYDFPSPSKYMSSWLSLYEIENLSQKDKVLHLIKHNHFGEWVRSQDLQEEYRIVYGENIKLSSISTYLARFWKGGVIERKGSRAQREYKIPLRDGLMV